MVLCYPVITADEYAHVGSITHVSGCQPGTPGYEYFSLDKHVSGTTCPAFLWHTVTDDCVPVENTLAMVAALRRHHVPVEAHLFPAGEHGLGHMPCGGLHQLRGGDAPLLNGNTVQLLHLSGESQRLHGAPSPLCRVCNSVAPTEGKINSQSVDAGIKGGGACAPPPRLISEIR